MDRARFITLARRVGPLLVFFPFIIVSQGANPIAIAFATIFVIGSVASAVINVSPDLRSRFRRSNPRAGRATSTHVDDIMSTYRPESGGSSAPAPPDPRTRRPD